MNHISRGVLFTFLLTCTAFFSIVYTSCTKRGGTSSYMDKCAAISCAYGGRCDQGKCICPTGYEGENCQIVNRNRFLGSWQVNEDGSLTERTSYTLVIEKDGNADAPANAVFIRGLYNYFNVALRATVVGDSIFIPNQQVLGKVVFGRGIIHTDNPLKPYDRINMAYEVVDSVNNNIVDDFGYYQSVDGSQPSMWTKN